MVMLSLSRPTGSHNMASPSMAKLRRNMVLSSPMASLGDTMLSHNMRNPWV